MKTLLASAAAFGMAITPVAAQAGTRAADSTVTLASMERQASPLAAFEGLGNNGSRICGRADNPADIRRGRCDLLLYLGGAAVVIAVIIAIGGGSGNSGGGDSSFGTGG